MALVALVAYRGLRRQPLTQHHGLPKVECLHPQAPSLLYHRNFNVNFNNATTTSPSPPQHARPVFSGRPELFSRARGMFSPSPLFNGLH